MSCCVISSTNAGETVRSSKLNRTETEPTMHIWCTSSLLWHKRAQQETKAGWWGFRGRELVAGDDRAGCGPPEGRQMEGHKRWNNELVKSGGRDRLITAVGVQSREPSWWAAGVQRRVYAVGARRPRPALGKKKNMDTKSRGELDPDRNEDRSLKTQHMTHRLVSQFVMT